MVYLVILNLGSSEDTYPNLMEYLKSFNYWARPMPNVWFIDTFYYSSTIRDGVKNMINPSDKAIVIEVAKNWASFNIANTITDWMKKNI